MKKVLALFGALFVFAGTNAQTPTLKKETLQPVPVSSSSIDTMEIVKPGNTPIQHSAKAIKVDQIKKAPTVQMKKAPIQMKKAPATSKSLKR